MENSTSTDTVSEQIINKSKKKHKKKRAVKEDFDTILQKAIICDNTCMYTRCHTSIKNFAIDCKYCNGRYCVTHALPEIHGCGDAVKRDEIRKFHHPQPTLSQEKHSQAADKLAARLKHMQFERKSKQGSTKSKK